MGHKMADYEKYLGKYDRTAADKYDEFLSELGVNMLLRKAATASSPVFEVTYDTDLETWSFKTSTMLKSMELKFKLDEEFDEKSPDGRDVKAKVTFEDGKIVTVQKAKKDGEKSTKSVRELEGDELVYTMTIDGVDDLKCVQSSRGSSWHLKIVVNELFDMEK